MPVLFEICEQKKNLIGNNCIAAMFRSEQNAVVGHLSFLLSLRQVSDFFLYAARRLRHAFGDV